MIKIEQLLFRYIWSMMTRSIHECWHVRTNRCVRTNICKKSVFVVSVRNINICGSLIILTQFTGLLPTNTVAAQRDFLAERTVLGKSVSVSLENEINKILGSKRVDRFSDHFSDLVQNICSVPFLYLLRLCIFCKAPRDMQKFPQEC